MLILLVVGLRL